MAISNIPSNMTAPPQSPGGNQSLAGSLGSPPRRSNATSSSSSSSAFKPLPPLLTGRTEAGICTAILHGRSPVLVVAGGRTTTTTTSRQNNNNGHETTMMISRRVELLEWSIQRRWWRLPDLTTPRYGFAMVGIGAQLCCIGGLGNPASTAPYASMETLTLGQDDAQWQVVTTTTATARDQQSSLQTPRMYPAAVTYSDGGSSKILVVGGRDASLQELDTCEVYSLETQRWNHHHSHDEQPIMPMDSPRFACGLVYVPSIHVVVAVGGYNGSHWTTSCESYDIVENCWKNDIPPMLRPVQFVSATLLSSGSQGQDYIVVRGVPVDGDDADEDHHEGAGGNVAVLQCYNILMEEWMMLPPTSSLVGAAMTSMDQTRIVTVGGGGAAAAASKDCRFWMPNLTKLFREDNHLDASLKLDEVTMSGSVAASAMDESTVHPWLYGPSGSASVAASVARSVAASTTTTTTNRRKVEDEPLLDNFGVQVRFTGYIHGESGRPQGKGRMTWTVTGDRYEGRFEQGARSGKGHMMYHNGDTFVGYFQDDRREGKGTYQYRDGRVYEGNYQMDLPNDTNGVMTWKDGTKFVGEFRRAKRTGKGKLTFQSSNVTYEGDFVNGRYQGFGRCQFQDESVYEGEWKSGKAHGIGRLVAADGSVIHDGRWANDGPVYDDDE